VLDCINNVSHIGHCHPYYVEKMQKQLEVLLTNSRFLYDQIMEATEKLLSTLPKELCVVTFTNSGSEANDLALQMAEIHTSKKGIICLEGAYHGITRSCHQISPYKWNRDSSKA
jgi:ethanolamine-phosphate phospho-lyase